LIAEDLKELQLTVKVEKHQTFLVLAQYYWGLTFQNVLLFKTNKIAMTMTRIMNKIFVKNRNETKFIRVDTGRKRLYIFSN
jgi:hypothetical protein